MSKVIAGAAISLDGFINDRHGSVEVLYPDLLALHIMPILLGGGLRMFDTLDNSIQLERIKVVELPGGRTHLEFRITTGARL